MAQKSRRRGNGKSDILEQLAASNFTICEKIITRSEDNKQIMTYIKCTTPLGQPVYVEADNSPSVDKEATMAEVNSLNTMSEEIKRKHFKNAGSNVSGIVLECEHNICTLSRNIEKEHPEERNFVYLNPDSNKKTLMGDNPNPIPIVKMEDIRANAPQSIAMINESTIRIRRGMHEEGLKKFEVTRKALQDIYEELTKFSNSIDDKLTGTIGILAGLEDRQKFILENGLDQEEGKIMNLLNNNAVRFNEMIAEENRCIMAVNSCSIELEKIANKIKNTNQYLQEKYDTTIEALEKSKQEIKS